MWRFAARVYSSRARSEPAASLAATALAAAALAAAAEPAAALAAASEPATTLSSAAESAAALAATAEPAAEPAASEPAAFRATKIPHRMPGACDNIRGACAVRRAQAEGEGSTRDRVACEGQPYPATRGSVPAVRECLWVAACARPSERLLVSAVSLPCVGGE